MDKVQLMAGLWVCAGREVPWSRGSIDCWSSARLCKGTGVPSEGLQSLFCRDKVCSRKGILKSSHGVEWIIHSHMDLLANSENSKAHGDDLRTQKESEKREMGPNGIEGLAAFLTQSSFLR